MLTVGCSHVNQVLNFKYSGPSVIKKRKKNIAFVIISLLFDVNVISCVIYFSCVSKLY